jgi:hypothetical protein
VLGNNAAGNDIIVFGVSSGNDTVTGFDANAAGGQDLINLTSRGITAATFAGSVTITAGANGSTVINIGGETITLEGVAPAAVTVADFILA